MCVLCVAMCVGPFECVLEGLTKNLTKKVRESLRKKDNTVKKKKHYETLFEKNKGMKVSC